MAACPASSAAALSVREVLALVDCEAGGLAAAGHAALFGAEAAWGAVLTGVLTLVVAWHGYRLFLGRAPTSPLVALPTLLSLGFALALATQWSAYQVLVADLLLRGPEELAGHVLRVAAARDLISSDDVLDGLQRAYDGLNRAADAAARAAGDKTLLQGGLPFHAFAYRASGVLLMGASLGLLATARLVLAVLLALGPAFVLAAVWRPTRGLAIGWARAAAAGALANGLGLPAIALVLLIVQPLAAGIPSDPAAAAQQGDTRPVALLVVCGVSAMGLALTAGAAVLMAASLSPSRASARWFSHRSERRDAVPTSTPAEILGHTASVHAVQAPPAYDVRVASTVRNLRVTATGRRAAASEAAAPLAQRLGQARRAPRPRTSFVRAVR